jgi:hypothetical protein
VTQPASEPDATCQPGERLLGNRSRVVGVGFQDDVDVGLSSSTALARYSRALRFVVRSAWGRRPHFQRAMRSD